MSEDTNEKNFEYTKASYWKGSQISPSLFKSVVVLGGFFGLDHYLLRSPKTGILKTIVNFFTLGFWYFYDILQTFTDFDFIREYGYAVPGLGPQGIGAGMIFKEGEQGTAPENAPNPIFFMLYAALIFVPFGISHFIAGDTYGGLAKLVLSINPFTFLIGFAWALYSAYTLYMNTESLFTEGTDRMIPISALLGSIGPAPNLINPNAGKEEGKGILETIFNFLAPVLGPLQIPFFQKMSEIGEKGMELTGATAEPEIVKQTGGGLEGSTVSQILFFGTAAMVLVGSIGLTIARYWKASKTEEKGIDMQNDLPPEVTDAPPSGPRPL